MHLITTPIEHPAVLETMRFLESRGFEVTILPVDGEGLLDPADVAAAVREDTILVSVMHTNNEIGTVQPLSEIGEAIKKKNPRTLFHVDAVQGFGKARIYPARMKIDLLTVSGHKIHGPKGVGTAEGTPLRHRKRGRDRRHGPGRKDALRQLRRGY